MGESVEVVQSRSQSRYRGLDLSAVNDHLRDRFWSKVDRNGECWVWTAHRQLSGYGQFTVSKGHFVTVSAASYALTFGLVPPGSHVCHRCDNPPCVRPDHLFLGTAHDNAMDMWRKGRDGGRSRGTERANARLTDDAVRTIRAERKRYGYLRDLSRRFGVSTTTIQKVRSGSKWSHVT